LDETKGELIHDGSRYRRLGAMLATGVRHLVPVCQKDGECRDLVDFVQTQQNWLFEAIRQTTSDIRALAGWKLELRTYVRRELDPERKTVG